MQVTFSADITELNGHNSATYTLRCAALDDDMELSELAGQYSVKDYAVEPFAADGSSTFAIELEAADDFTTGNRTTSVSTAFTLMNWGKDGRSMGIGKVAEKTDTLQIALDVEFIGKVKGTIFDAIYPIDSIYISYSHTDPATLFGGTWERITGAFLYGVLGTSTIGYRGGEASHTLTLDEMPSHAHGLRVTTNGTLDSSSYIKAEAKQGGSYYTPHTFYEGGDKPHNNMPPYVQVSIWRRTA